MLRVADCIFEQHDLRLVALAALLCLLASTTAMSMIARGRATKGRMRIVWLAAGGVVAGCGIWGLHFVAMLAYHTGLPVAYDPWQTAVSALIASSICGAGFAIALSRAGAAAGGAVAGAAISAMHYAGMAAMRISADPHWDAVYVLVSVLIGVVFTALALHVALRRDEIRGYAVGAGLFLIAIVGLHFTAMAAVVYVPNPTIVISGAVIEPSVLAVAVAAAVVLIMALGLIGALVDHHLAARASSEAQRLHAHIAELELTKATLENTSENLTLALADAAAGSRAKSAFLAAMSHELRTPLNAVIGFADILALETFGPHSSPRYKSYSNDIRASGVHLLSLINDILDLSRIDGGGMSLEEEEIDLRLLVTQALSMVSHQAEAAQIVLREEIEPGLPFIRGSERRLKQVLINLLVNAIKFTGRSGCVRIQARPNNSNIAIAVIDNGIGIAEEDIPRALERFGQVDSSLARKYEGAGLGLPLSKQLVELHGGSLEVQSAVNIGTTVTILLPASRIVTSHARLVAAE